jgi:chromosomal replication initiation ATPase DnaA
MNTKLNIATFRDGTSLTGVIGEESIAGVNFVRIKTRLGTFYLSPSLVAKISPSRKADNLPPMEEIVSAVSTYFDTPSHLITSIRRQECLVLPRFITYKLARESGMSYMHIGRELGRDHGSIMHGCRRINDLISIKDEKTMNALNALRKQLTINPESE